MPLTSNCDALVKLNESAFNTVIRQTMLQKPAWFNYATKRLILSNTFCVPVAVDPLLAESVAKATEIDPLPIIGAPLGTAGMDFCFQITGLKIDFNPGNSIALPPELHLLGSQEIALKGTIQAGIACRQVLLRDDLRRLNEFQLPEIPDRLKEHEWNEKITNLSGIQRGLIFTNLLLKQLQSFKLSFYAKARVIQETGLLQLRLTAIEIQDLVPLGLENSIECYIRQVLDLTVLPKMKIALNKLVFSAKNYFTVSFKATSNVLPFNPDVSDNEITVFTNLN